MNDEKEPCRYLGMGTVNYWQTKCQARRPWSNRWGLGERLRLGERGGREAPD